MTEVTKITRSTFMATSAAAGGGIVFGLPFPKMGPKFAKAAFRDLTGGAEINAYVHVAD